MIGYDDLGRPYLPSGAAANARLLDAHAEAARKHADDYRERFCGADRPDPTWVDPEGRRVRMAADHVLVLLKPIDEQTAGGVVLVRDRKTVVKEPRIARVLAVGPGHWTGCRHCSTERRFVPTTVQVGEEVLIPYLAGADWSLDRMPPRHMRNGVEFEIHDERTNNYGESQLIGDLRLSTLRVVREEEIIGVIEP